MNTHTADALPPPRRHRSAALWLLNKLYEGDGLDQLRALSRRGPVSDTNMWDAGQCCDRFPQRLTDLAVQQCHAQGLQLCKSPEFAQLSTQLVKKADQMIAHGCTLQAIG